MCEVYEWAYAHYGGRMPTSPSHGSAAAPAAAPHSRRDMAESFGVDTDRYDRTRPPYPDALVDRIVAAAPGRDVLDVGCGTGIAARQLRAAGCTVLGVEPDARMADHARRDGLEVEVATFESWDPRGRTFDAVVAATAWHWIDPVKGAAKAAGVLRPGGLLTAFWHVFALPAEVADAFAEAYERAVPDAPIDVRAMRTPMAAYQKMADTTVQGLTEAGGFGTPEHWRFDWERTYTRDEWLDQMPTSGALTRLPEDKLAALLEATGEAIDRLGGSFTLPYTTVAVAATATR